MKVVISIGGSLLTKELTFEHFSRYADAIKDLAKKHSIAVICGGGKIAREFRDIAKNAGREERDFIGIMATHLNASTLTSAIGKDAYLIKWKSLKDALKELKRFFGKKIVVGGGYDVGTSTDYDAAIFAKAVKADLIINATNVDGVYSDDPKKNPNAKKFNNLTYQEFIKILSKLEQTPGEYRLFDLKGAKLMKQIKARLVVVNGNDTEEIVRAVTGTHKGTVIA
ncbi:MAG: UMP kinase [Candidatus Aenigmarchaeota archaeon]|nr:UMP kinase [Candidatus Aenigmarchaeota archaeon]